MALTPVFSSFSCYYYRKMFNETPAISLLVPLQIFNQCNLQQ